MQVKGMVQVDGVTYRIVRVSSARYDVIRVLDGAEAMRDDDARSRTPRSQGTMSDGAAASHLAGSVAAAEQDLYNRMRDRRVASGVGMNVAVVDMCQVRSAADEQRLDVDRRCAKLGSDTGNQVIQSHAVVGRGHRGAINATVAAEKNSVEGAFEQQVARAAKRVEVGHDQESFATGVMAQRDRQLRQNDRVVGLESRERRAYGGLARRRARVASARLTRLEQVQKVVAADIKCDQAHVG